MGHELMKSFVEDSLGIISALYSKTSRQVSTQGVDEVVRLK